MAESAPRARVDPYGFERPDDFDHSTYEDFMSNYLSVLARRAKKWEDFLESHHDVKRGTKVKRYVRKGIPREHRGQVWMTVSGAQFKKEQMPGLFKELLQLKWNEELVETIKIDVPRTFPDNIYFKDAIDGKRQPLFNVLVAHAHHNSGVGYCQGLNFIAGILLLITEEEETTFWLLNELTNRILPDYYTNDMLGLLTDIEVLSELIKTKNPQIHQHLAKHGVAWPILTTKWFICLYAEVLPIETVLRIWDCLFYEGSKILFRVALTVILKNEAKILAADSFPEITTVFKEISNDLLVTDCHTFLQGIFSQPGSLPMALINKLRQTCRVKIIAQKEELSSR